MGTPVRVLVIDDEDDVRDIVSVVLGEVAGWSVTSVASGLEALALTPLRPWDVVLLDATMPGLDGASTCARMRERADLRGVPIVFLTASVGPDDVERYLAMGATGVIRKPFDPMGLAGEVLAVVGARA